MGRGRGNCKDRVGGHSLCALVLRDKCTFPRSSVRGGGVRVFTGKLQVRLADEPGVWAGVSGRLVTVG